jgi:ribonuclease R
MIGEEVGAALRLESRVGQWFDAMATAASEKGTWVRLFRLPVEGKLMRGYECLGVGDKVRVGLTQTF